MSNNFLRIMDKPEVHVHRPLLDCEAEVVDAGALPLEVIKAVPFLRTCSFPAHMQECSAIEVLQLTPLYLNGWSKGTMKICADGACLFVGWDLSIDFLRTGGVVQTFLL